MSNELVVTLVQKYFLLFKFSCMLSLKSQKKSHSTHVAKTNKSLEINEDTY